MSVRIAIVNESFEPLGDIEVEAYDAAADEIAATATTDKGGICTFDTLDFPLESILFKPRNTRSAGPEGEPPPLTAGQKALEAANKNTGFGNTKDPDKEPPVPEKEEGSGATPMGIMHIQMLGP